MLTVICAFTFITHQYLQVLNNFPINQSGYVQLLNKIFAVELKRMSSGISNPAAVNDWMMLPS